jgi:hypothetical protein
MHPKQAMANVELGRVLSAAIKDYNQAAVESFERYEIAYEEKLTAFEQQTEEWNAANIKHRADQKKVTDLLEIAVELGRFDMPKLRDTVFDLYENESAELDKGEEKLRAEQARISESNEQNGKKLNRYFKVHQKKVAIARERAKTYRVVAEMAGLKLDV